MTRLATLLLLLASCSAPPGLPGLENVHELAPGLLSGGSPEGDAAYAGLAAKGVKTLVSVDGARPDVEAARRHGLRYVHLPLGYDGVPAARAMELAKAVRELPGPVYVHCHHGRHRGPAAAAVAGVIAGKLDAPAALEAMRVMGTDPAYRGLWEAARAARPADPAALDALRVEFREIAPVPPLSEAMVELDRAADALAAVRRARWASPAAPDAALRARELLSELLRSDETRGRPAAYRELMGVSARAARAIEDGIRSKAPAADLDRAHDAFARSCTACHRPYRDAPRDR